MSVYSRVARLFCRGRGSYKPSVAQTRGCQRDLLAWRAALLRASPVLAESHSFLNMAVRLRSFDEHTVRPPGLGEQALFDADFSY